MEERISDPTHSFLIEEAMRLGSVEKAILLKEVRRMAIYKVRAGKDPWVFYSGRMLCEKFPYMSQRSTERWMRELEESGDLISSVRNKTKYDKTKSYTLPQFESIHEQNGESSEEDGEPIPPLSAPRTIKAENFEDEVPASFSSEDIRYEATDEDGAPLTRNGFGRRPRAAGPPKNKVAFGLVAEFRGMVLKELGINPTIGKEGYMRALAALNAGLTAEQIRLLFQDWFSSKGKDEDKSSITAALSNNAINKFKVREGIV